MPTDEVLLNESNPKKRKLKNTWSFWIGIILFVVVLLVVFFTVTSFDTNEDNGEKFKQNFWILFSGNAISVGFILFGFLTTKYDGVNDYGNKIKKKAKYAGNEAGRFAYKAGGVVSSVTLNPFIPISD